MNFIPSQQQIENNKLVQSGANVLIKAGAGCSKSTSLRFFAQQNPNKNFLVLCFNKANAEEALAHPDRPKNAYYATGHSIAYGKIVTGALRNSFNNSGINYTDIEENALRNSLFWPACASQAEERFAITSFRKRIKQCIELYCRSASKNLEAFANSFVQDYFSTETIIVNDPVIGPVPEKTILLTEVQQKELASFIKQFWLNMIDPNNHTVFGHDQYLKLYHLKGLCPTEFYDKQTKKWVNIDVLCLDEAQDSNPVMIEIFDNFNGQKIVVGDEAQQLYSWRGAISAIKYFEEKNYAAGYLTESFRFNEQIAEDANVLLEIMGQEYSLTGVSKKTEIKTTAYLGRTNSAVINKLLSLVGEFPDRKFNVALDLNDVARKLYHLNAVSFGQTPKYPDNSLAHIKTKRDLNEACIISQEIEALDKLRATIRVKAGSLHNGLQILKNAVDKNVKDITLSTIHKSKGLEWDEVIILDDLISFERNIEGEVSEEEFEAKASEFREDFELQCLAYVAGTRAKVETHWPWYWNDIINFEI